MPRPLASAVLCALLLLPAPVALAAPTAPTAHRSATRVVGWDAAPTEVEAGKPLRVSVRASGPKRVVALQRLTGSGWHRVALAVEASDGSARLRWTPVSSGRAVLRVHVRPDAKRAAVSTGRRTVTVSPAASPTRTAQTGSDPQLDRVLVLVNAARAAGATCGSTVYPTAPALTRSGPLDGIAQSFAQRMATEDFFSHTGPDGSTPRSRAAAAGLPWPAENIAAGYTTAESVVNGWLRSEGHCRNLMSASSHRVGLGRATSSTARFGTYWVQDFTG